MEKLMDFPDPVPRQSPYTYTTWLSKVISSDHQCHYAGWFKSHFTHSALLKDFNLDAWTAPLTATELF
jgi:hypothetical protein